jgi:hypothetical protein
MLIRYGKYLRTNIVTEQSERSFGDEVVIKKYIKAKNGKARTRLNHSTKLTYPTNYATS